MMWRSSGCGRLGLLLGALMWMASVSGWAGPPKKKVPNEAGLREAEGLKVEYERLYEEGKYDEAAALAERACMILRKERGGESLEAAKCLNDLGNLEMAQGAYEKAESLFGRTLAIREKALGHDHPDVATSLNDLAVLYFYRGEYDNAARLQEQALTIYEKTLDPYDPLIATGLINLSTLYVEQGVYGRAEPLLERALAIHERALDPHHPLVATSLNSLAALHTAQGAYGKAEPLYQRALKVREEALGPNHPDVAMSLNNLASLYDNQGAYGKAEPLYQRALAIVESAFGTDHPHVAVALGNLADLYHDQGAWKKAEMLLERALAIHETTLGPDHFYVAHGLNNLATVYYRQGAYEKAEPLHERALVIRERAFGTDHPDVARSLNNLAMLYDGEGEHERAKSLQERALSIFEKSVDPSHPDVALSLNNLGMIYHHQAEYGKAELLHEQALASFETVFGPRHLLVATSLANLAILYHDQRMHHQALAPHRRAFDIEESNLARALTVADEARRLAFASTLSGSLDYALSLHLRVIPEHDAIVELALTTLLRRKNRVQDLVAQSTAALRRSLPEDDQHLLDDLSDVDSRVAVLSSRGPGKLTVEAFAQQLDELGQQRDRLWGELAKHSAIVETLGHPVTIEDVQQALHNSSTLVEIIQYVPQHDDAGVRLRTHETKPLPRYAAYLVFPDRFDWVDLGPAAPIDEHVRAFRKALQTKQAIPTDLYDAVMRPVVEKLGSTHRLVIAPAGALSLVPFGALHDGERYLIEKYDLRNVTTGRDLLDPPASAAVTTNPVTVIANPTGAFLPDAEIEAEFLEGFFPDTRVLRGDVATETNVRTVERPLILHMATHGFFGEARNERDNPMFRSGLYLADIEQVEVDREHDDGQLTAYEVSGMDLRGTQLVVLSACETGMGAELVSEGKVLMSEGVSGLRRAFAMAGARTTVMSLWEVSGVTAQKTMEAYYRKLAEGQGPGEAMQAVQLEMLQTKEHAHPKDWAVFIVSGDDDPLDFPAGQEPRVETPPSKPPGPPPVRRRPGCAIAAPSSDRDPSPPALLVGLLALRRRRQ